MPAVTDLLRDGAIKTMLRQCARIEWECFAPLTDNQWVLNSFLFMHFLTCIKPPNTMYKYRNLTLRSFQASLSPRSVSFCTFRVLCTSSLIRVLRHIYGISFSTMTAALLISTFLNSSRFLANTRKIEAIYGTQTRELLTFSPSLRHINCGVWCLMYTCIFN